MARSVLGLLLPLLAALPSSTLARGVDVTPQDLRRHIEVLASDDYQGRKPGTEGETKTLVYLAGQMQAMGLKPGAGDDSWYQPVPLIERQAASTRASWTAGARTLPFQANNIVMMGNEAAKTLRDAPVWFAGHGVHMPDKGIDQLAGADFRGAVVLILYDGPEIENFPSFSERVRTVIGAGAAAVIGIVGDDTPWSDVVESFTGGQTRLDEPSVPALQGATPLPAATRLIGDAGGDFEKMLNETTGPAFRAVRLPLAVSLEVTTEVRRFTSYNVIGKLEGRGRSGESVLFLGHWDHLGICRAEGEDRICNGAVDNASGLAVLLETARHLASGPAMNRDILFMGTTAEEMGLLGARWFAAHTPVPIKSIVAAVNMDTVAIAPAGQPVAMIGRTRNNIAPLVDEAARSLGREIDGDQQADALIQRQDGWPLDQAGIPTVMAGGSISDLSVLGRFLSGPYHKPNDDLSTPLVLEGAAEDTELLIALGRLLADPAQYRPEH